MHISENHFIIQKEEMVKWGITWQCYHSSAYKEEANTIAKVAGFRLVSCKDGTAMGKWGSLQPQQLGKSALAWVRRSLAQRRPFSVLPMVHLLPIDSHLCCWPSRCPCGFWGPLPSRSFQVLGTVQVLCTCCLMWPSAVLQGESQDSYSQTWKLRPRRLMKS